MSTTAQTDIVKLQADRLRYVNELSAGLAHELNQPLSGISMFAENILYSLKENLPLSNDEIEHSMNRIIEQTERITKLVTHIRQFSRDDERKELMPTNLDHVIKSITQLLKTQLASHEIEFDIINRDNTVCIIKANPFSLEEVIFNLITNARDALDLNETAQKKLTIEFYQERDYCTIKIADTGIGMDKETLSKVFDPFFTTKGPDRGVGLGLPVTKSVIEDIGGRIDIKSALGEGTVVTLYIPEHKDNLKSVNT